MERLPLSSLSPDFDLPEPDTDLPGIGSRLPVTDNTFVVEYPEVDKEVLSVQWWW